MAFYAEDEGGVSVEPGGPLAVTSGLLFGGHRYAPQVNGNKLEFVRAD